MSYLNINCKINTIFTQSLIGSSLQFLEVSHSRNLRNISKRKYKSINFGLININNLFKILTLRGRKNLKDRILIIKVLIVHKLRNINLNLVTKVN